MATTATAFRLTTADLKNLEAIRRRLSRDGYSATATAALRYALYQTAQKKEAAA